VHKQQRRGVPEHERYEVLCTLAAGGLLETTEIVDFQAHLKECKECQLDYQESSSLVTGELPQAQGAFGQKLAEMRAKPLPDSRQRFLRRAGSEGVVFSQEVLTPVRSSAWRIRPIAMLAPIAVLLVVTVGLAVYRFRETRTPQSTDAASAHQISDLKRENSALAASLSRLNESLAAERREIQNLRALATARGQAERSSNRNVQPLEESRSQEKLLAEARDEATRDSQLRINDEASLVEQQARITELSSKLRLASATLDQERQLVEAGKDIRELMAARQLHVIDVRDTDPNGKSSEAFGRVFLTEAKSLTFYAFELNEGMAENAKRSFQVWAVSGSGKNSSRSLGFLRVDAKAQGRWVLKVENPELVKQISAVFVTAEPANGGKQPSGQKMLYAFLGESNHP
jgi:hypothetical protein